MARLRSIRRLWLRLGQTDARQKALLAEAALFLLLARLVLIFIAFPRLARWLGKFVPPAQAQAFLSQRTATIDEIQDARDIGWAVLRAARHLPFRAVCLPQAMAARAMLQRRGIHSVMHFGVSKFENRPMEAHAWLDAAGIEVTGFPVAAHFAEIACFT